MPKCNNHPKSHTEQLFSPSAQLAVTENVEMMQNPHILKRLPQQYTWRQKWSTLHSLPKISHVYCLWQKAWSFLTEFIIKSTISFWYFIYKYCCYKNGEATIGGEKVGRVFCVWILDVFVLLHHLKLSIKKSFLNDMQNVRVPPNLLPRACNVPPSCKNPTGEMAWSQKQIS